MAGLRRAPPLAKILLALNVACASGRCQLRRQRHLGVHDLDSDRLANASAAGAAAGAAPTSERSGAHSGTSDDDLQGRLTAYFNAKGLSQTASEDVALERSFRYLKCPCMARRQEYVARLFEEANCSVVYEVGAMWEPLSDFASRARGLTYVNIDPTARPAASAVHGVRTVHLPMMLAEFVADPELRSRFELPELAGACVAALGIFTPHLRSEADEGALVALTRGAKLVALEAAISQTGCKDAFPTLQRASRLLEAEGWAVAERRPFDCTGDRCVKRLFAANGYRQLRVFRRPPAPPR